MPDFLLHMIPSDIAVLRMNNLGIGKVGVAYHFIRLVTRDVNRAFTDKFKTPIFIIFTTINHARRIVDKRIKQMTMTSFRRLRELHLADIGQGTDDAGSFAFVCGGVFRTQLHPMRIAISGNQTKLYDGIWNIEGWKLMAAGLFIAAWSTYAFETAVCYTREFKNPKTDTFKAIFYSGLLCIAVYTLVPIAFQAHLGLGHLVTPAVTDAAGNVTTAAVYDGMLAPEIYSGMGVAGVLSSMLGGSELIVTILVIMLVLALLLSIMTSMAGSSRTLYQASVDGWLPKYLSQVNEHGAPTKAMWTDLCFNLLLLLMSDYVFVLAASNVGYIIFNFLNLNSGWIHRMDRPNWDRPYKAPTILLLLGGLLGFVNLGLMGLGADVWGAGTLNAGLFFATLIVPVFIYRHFIQDKGVFPSAMLEDMQLDNAKDGVMNRAGVLPYIALLVGVFIVFWLHSI